MVIQCEKCRTKFNLDKSLLNKNGSKVRCSKCKYVFTAFPDEQNTPDINKDIKVENKELEKTLVQDPPQIKEAITSGNQDKDILNHDEPKSENFDGTPEFKYLDTADQEQSSEVSPSETEKSSKTKEAPAKEKTIPSLRPIKPERNKLILVLKIFIIIIVIVIGGIVGIMFFAPEMIPKPFNLLKSVTVMETTDMGVSRLEFPFAEGSFMTSAEGGSLFVIRGKIKNNYSSVRRFILIKGSILNDKGQVIKKKVAYAGNILSDSEIKTLSIAKINEMMKRRHNIPIKNLTVTGGGLIPFVIVLENLPKNISEFTVEAISSSPGP